MSDPFFQEPVSVTIQDKEIAILPIKVKHLSKAARLAAPVIEAIAAPSSGRSLNIGDIIQNIDSVIELVALVCDLEIEWVGNLNSAELLQLVTPILEVNTDFFIQQTLPILTKSMEMIATTVGRASSSDVLATE